MSPRPEPSRPADALPVAVVTGAAGTIGTLLTARLVAAGHRR